MAYAPPAGDAIVFDFGGVYVPPPGGNIEFLFGEVIPPIEPPIEPPVIELPIIRQGGGAGLGAGQRPRRGRRAHLTILPGGQVLYTPDESVETRDVEPASSTPSIDRHEKAATAPGVDAPLVHARTLTAAERQREEEELALMLTLLH